MGKTQTNEPSAPAHAARLRGLVLAARGAQGEARTALAGEINRVLTQLPESGGEAEAVLPLLRELDSPDFDAVVDDAGVSSRKAAALALLSFGDSVKPTPTAYTRKLKKSRLIAAGLASVTCVALVPAVVSALLEASFLLPVAWFFQVLLSAGSTVYLAEAMPPLERQAVPIAGVVFGTLVALCLIPAAGLAGLVAAGGSAAALAVLIGWQYDDAGRDDGLIPQQSMRHWKNPFDNDGR
jgi:hypothetical protein